MSTAMSLPRLVGERPRQLFGALFALFLLLVGSWAAATPLGDAPDEWAHVFRASGVVTGQVNISGSEPLDPLGGDVVRVPATLAARAAITGCYAFDPDSPVSCARNPKADDATVAVKTAAGRYPPFYYAVVGWPLAFNSGSAALYLARFVAAALAAAFLAGGALAALRLRGRWVMTGFLVGMVPMTAYLGGMINPNGLEIAAAAALWPNLLLWLRGGTAPLRRAGLTVAAVAASAMVLSRPVSILWLLIAVVSLVVLSTKRWWRDDVLRGWALWRIGVVVAALATAGGWAVLSRQFDISSIVGTDRPYWDWVGEGMAWQWWRRWGESAVARMGWMDTPVDSVMYLFVAAALAVLFLAALAGLAQRSWRRLLAALLATVLTLAATLLMAASQANVMGLGFWQGRYSLPLAVGVPVLFAFAAARLGPRWNRHAAAVSAVVLTLVAVVQVDAFLRFFHRNSVGLREPFAWSGGWQPPLGIGTWFATLLVAVGGLAAVGLAAAITGDRDLEPPGPRAPSVDRPTELLMKETT